MKTESSDQNNYHIPIAARKNDQKTTSKCPEILCKQIKTLKKLTNLHVNSDNTMNLPNRELRPSKLRENLNNLIKDPKRSIQKLESIPNLKNNRFASNCEINEQSREDQGSA